MEYGLIGKTLKHSFSKEIHEEIGSYHYELKELDENQFIEFFEKKEFKAINVTIPYKEKVIPYLHYISPEAKKIGAVNTIVNKDGLLYGYNTDYFGLKALIEFLSIEINNKDILILGTGGTSKTAHQLFTDLGAKNIYFASRKTKVSSESYFSYDDLSILHDKVSIIINTTPCGMFPNNSDSIIDISSFSNLKGVIDVIYNPLRTNLVLDAKKKNITASGGLYMLIAQAFYAIEIFTNTKLDKDIINKLYKKIINQKENVVLVGMPACGKSTKGRELSKILNRKFIDVDQEIIKRINMEISEYFKKYGEDSFRDIEEEVIKELSKKTSVVIATGGGSILRDINIKNLKQNGKIFFINRDVSLLLTTSSRPLSSNYNDLKKRFDERYEKYVSCSDVIIDSNSTVEACIEKIIKARDSI